MKKLILPAFALMVLAQWMVPAKMILDSEAVLTSGTEYKFRTEPIDPSDPFRGKYVTLRYNAQRFETDTLYMYEEGQEVYALLALDSAGYVEIANLNPDPPTDQDYNILKTNIGYVWINNGRQIINLNFSFDRFYVEESKASETEQVYWNAQRDSAKVAYAVVKILNGQGIIKDVMINDRPILEIVQEMNEKETLK
jgi:uncharacterized membrane-anchored protein